MPKNPPRKKSDLRPVQIYMAKKIKGRKALLLAVEMAVGKTASTLTAVRRLLDEFMIRRVLIVAPKRVAEETWPDEIEAWAHTRVLRYSVIVGNEKQRLAALQKDVPIHIINRENLSWLWRTLKGKKGWCYDMIVYDESSRLKAGKHMTKGGETKGKRLSEFGTLARARSLVDYVVLLSGTPAPNGLIDLWGQIYIVDQGRRLGGTKKAFLDRWFNSDYMGWKHEPKPGAEEEVMDLISDVMVGLRAEDHVELPPVYPNVVKVKLKRSVLAEYKKFERTLVSDAYDVEAVSKGVLTNKLLQFANGSVYRTDEDSGIREAVKIHNAKLDALTQIIEESPEEQILVAVGFDFDRQAILERYPHAICPKSDPKWKKKWDRKKAGLLLAHPDEIGHGMNLQLGGHILIWYGLTWSLELYQQFSARLARPGQPHPFVVMHHIIAEGTVDETALEALRMKGMTQDELTETIRRRIVG